MKPRDEVTVIREICEVLTTQGLEEVSALLGKVLNFAMELERREAIGAEPYERTESRQGHANGFKPKLLKTLSGAVPVNVPQVRGLQLGLSTI